MTGVILPMPLKRQSYGGTVCVLGDPGTGFQVAHESASGSSWGSFSGPYATGQDAIAAAYALNRDAYLGQCAVSVCDAALRDHDSSTVPPLDREDF